MKVEKLKANLEKLREAMRRGIKVRIHTVQKNKTIHNQSGDNQSKIIALTRLNDQGIEIPVHIRNLPGTSHTNDKKYAFVFRCFLYLQFIHTFEGNCVL